MGFLEFLGEPFNRGPVGDITTERPRLPRPPSPYALVWLGMAVFALAGWTLLLWRLSSSWERFWLGLLASGAYLAVAAFAYPRPNYSNVGFLGGLVDHPFRFTDDFNRFLAFLFVLFWPGRLIAKGLAHGAAALRGDDTKDTAR